MNVLIVTDTYPPAINGVARTLQTWAQGLAERGHQVWVATTTEGTPEDSHRNGINIHTVPSLPVPGYHGLRFGVTSSQHFSNLIRKNQIDRVYVAVESWMGLNAIRAARHSGIPIISGFHTNFHSYSKNYHLPILKRSAEWYLRHFHNRTAKTLTPSETTAAQLRDLGLHRVGVLGRGVDTRLFHPGRRDDGLRRSWGVDEKTPVALYVGRLAAEKNLPLAIKAFQQLMDQHPGTKVVLVGNGPLAQTLKEQHPHFIHAGARTGEDLARHYASADLFIFPSVSETFGNVITEALCSGLIAVCYDYAAARQYIRDGVNGFTATYNDEPAFLEAVSKAFPHWNDPAIRTAAAATSSLLSWDAIITQFESELSNACTVSTTDLPDHSPTRDATQEQDSS